MMPLSFLQPWLWLGALAIAAPIWLHLRRKKETNLQMFSAVRFLEDQPMPRRSPLRLRDLVLFALRVLALLLVVAAFTWPYLRGPDTLPVKESRVYIFDNTLSHQADGGFQRDRARLLREVGDAAPNIQVAVVELTATPRVLVPFGDDRATALAKIVNLQPSYQRGSYLAAFRQAASLLANSFGDQKRIVFLADNQANQWSEHISTPPFLRNVEVQLSAPGTASLPNLSLSEPRAQRIFLGDKSLVNFTVKLSHSGEARTATVAVQANGQTILNRAVDLEKQPETILLQAQWEADPGTWLRGETTVEGTPDALPADNRVFFGLPPVVEGRLALLARSRYLRVALSPEIMRGQWNTRFLDPAKLEAEAAPGQDSEVLCLESSYLQSTEVRKLVWRYLTNGRGVVLFVDRVTPAIKGCLRELGFEVEGPVQPGKDTPEKFQFIFLNHPVFHPFLSPDYGNLLEIKFHQYFKLRSSEALPLAFSEAGAGLVFQSMKFPGKLFVAAFGADREQSSWPVHQTFIPFLDLAFQAARAEDPVPSTFEPGEVALLPLPPASGVREVVLRNESREVARAPVVQGRAQLRMPDWPGTYRLTYDDNERLEKVFSVNPSAKESQLAYTQAAEVARSWQVNPGESPRKTASAPTVHASLSAILQQRLWWWMVVGGLGVLTLEMALAELVRKRA